ncbi:MAG: fumarylacetoacetate hydrolase family protein [Alphaproteobacteria bacterium]|nr:fumarylacetoacetate hydrolase family protein [Alphaproteobacteria bacterium]
MKLVRFGRAGQEKPGLLHADGRIRDLSKVVKDIDPTTIGQLSKLKSVKIDKLPVVKGRPRLGPPVARSSKFIAIGLNYSDHAAETNSPIPKEPIIFTKATTSICGPNDNVIQPKGSIKLDWEVELAFVIGRTARYVAEKDALRYVAGYMVCNDVSERHFQAERGGQWTKGKSADTFGPIGPWLVTPDEIKDPQNLAMFLDVNGERMQTGNTATMIFGVATILSYVSQFMTLLPGDLVTTGTPPGVGLGKKPPIFLKPGDVMRLGIAGLGEQQQKVVAYKGK